MLYDEGTEEGSSSLLTLWEDRWKLNSAQSLLSCLFIQKCTATMKITFPQSVAFLHTLKITCKCLACAFCIHLHMTSLFPLGQQYKAFIQPNEQLKYQERHICENIKEKAQGLQCGSENETFSSITRKMDELRLTIMSWLREQYLRHSKYLNNTR